MWWLNLPNWHGKGGRSKAVSWSHVEVSLLVVELCGIYRFQLCFSVSPLHSHSLAPFSVVFLFWWSLLTKTSIEHYFLEAFFWIVSFLFGWLDSRRTLLLKDCATSLFHLHAIDRGKFPAPSFHLWSSFVYVNNECSAFFNFLLWADSSWESIKL